MLTVCVGLNTVVYAVLMCLSYVAKVTKKAIYQLLGTEARCVLLLSILILDYIHKYCWF